MPSTQDVLSHCASLADRAFPETGSACSAREAALYLAHTGGGESLRALASATGTHPSTVMRTVRRVESQRDDPVVDDLISGLEKSAGLGDAELTSEGDDAGRQSVAALVPDVPAMPREALEREARRFLRRLSEPGSFMMVVPDAKKGGVFCKANDYRKPIAMMPVRLGAELVREGWIKVHMRGPNSVRYRITEDGRSCLKRLLAVDAVKRQPPTGFAERGNPFLAQHQLPGTRQVMDHATGRPQQIKVNLGEDPLGWLARRKGPDGKPFLTPDEVEAGERLRTDFELAQLGPSVAQDWRKFLTPGDRLAGSPPRGGPAGGPMAARDRVSAALAVVGPGLADAVLRVCCFLEGLEACERRMGWSARSGKVVLKIALQRLAVHYGYSPAPDNGCA